MDPRPRPEGLRARTFPKGGYRLKDYPKGGLVGKVVHAIISIKRMHIPLHAANAGYFIVLAVFPALLLVLNILRYTGIDVETLVELLDGFLPNALLDAGEELVISTYEASSGTLLGLSAITALWSASRGIYGVLTGLNAIYGVAEDRGYIYTRSISVLYTFLFLIVLLLTLVLHVFGNTIMGMLTMIDNEVLIFLIDLIDLRFFLLLAVQSLIFTIMFMALPNRRNGFWESLPGGVLSSLGWLIFSDIFSIYVENFNRYANIYGSIYAVALAMLWLYCCMSILFYGGALNRYLAEQKNA